jgi:hypothetical protein
VLFSADIAGLCGHGRLNHRCPAVERAFSQIRWSCGLLYSDGGKIRLTQTFVALLCHSGSRLSCSWHGSTMAMKACCCTVAAACLLQACRAAHTKTALWRPHSTVTYILHTKQCRQPLYLATIVQARCIQATLIDAQTPLQRATTRLKNRHCSLLSP